MRAELDGVDLFPRRKAAFIRSMAPSRIRVLGTVDPPQARGRIGLAARGHRDHGQQRLARPHPYRGRRRRPKKARGRSRLGRRLNDDPAPMVRAGAREQSRRSPRHAAGGGRPCCVRRQSLRRLHKRRQSPGRWRAHAISELIYSPRGSTRVWPAQGRPGANPPRSDARVPCD